MAGAIRWADPAGAHLTLKYLGETALRDQISAQLDQIGPTMARFVLQTAGVGAFPNRQQPRILWLGVSGALAALAVLQQAVEQRMVALGFAPETQAWTPHITLGRARGGPAQPLRGNAVTVPPQSWEVRSLALMCSERGPGGARYTAIHTVPFDAR